MKRSIFSPKDTVTKDTLGLISQSQEDFEALGLDALKDMPVDALVDLFVVKYNGNAIQMMDEEFIHRSWDDLEHELINRLYFNNVLKFARVLRMNALDYQIIFAVDKEYANN